MKPRDRVLAALAHSQPDRVPTDFWAVPEVWERLCRHFGVSERRRVLDLLEIDVRSFAPRYVGPERRVLEDGSFFAEDGTHRKIVKNEYGEYSEYASYPLARCETPEEIAAYDKWPRVSDWDWAGFSDRIGDAHETHYIKVEVGGPFELAWGLRGYEQFLVDLYESPEIARAILRERTEFYIEFIREAMRAAGDKIDAFYTYDDIAAQSSLLLSKSMWEEFIKPCHTSMNRIIKSYGKTIIYHSCGAIAPMIGSLAALPIDVLNPLQPKAAGMNMREIKHTWGEKLSFHGAICIQSLLPHGTPREVYDGTRETIRILGRGGGYILASAHHLQNDTPTENILAMYQAARDSGAECW